MISSSISASFVVACFAASSSAMPLAGGSDSCATPEVIAGVGPFAFDTTGATTGSEGQNEALCDVAGQIGIHRDVWFVWTAGFTGTAQLDTCSQTLLDSKVAIFDGSGCPTAGAIACVDDACGLQTIVQWAVTAGSRYVIQLGQWGGATPVPGTFRIQNVVPPIAPMNDDCSGPIAIVGPGTHAYDTSLATTGVPQPFTCPTAKKDIWYDYTATASGTASVSTCGLITSTYVDTLVAVWPGGGCPTLNPIACNDNAACASQPSLSSTLSFPIVCGLTYGLQIGQFGNVGDVVGGFAIVEAGTSCGPGGTPYCFGDGTGTPCPCGNNGAADSGCASSVSASGARLVTSGNSLLGSDTLVLQGSSMPDSFCLYFQGTTQVSTSFGDGLRCVGGSVTRLATKMNVGGASQFPASGDAPLHVQGGVTGPGTRAYQAWYRNAAAFCTSATFNLTNGVLVNWQ